MTEDQIDDAHVMANYLSDEIKKLVRFELLESELNEEQKEYALLYLREQLRF